MRTVKEILKIKPTEEVKKLPIIFKEKWIAALKSGSYKQGENVLFDPDDKTYCCLGVAAKVCEVGNSELASRTMLTSLPQRFERRLPKSLLGQQIQEQFVDFNDNYHFNFKQIASWIRKYL